MSDDKTQISIRVPTDILGKFDRIATGIDRDRTYVMVEAFRAYLEGEGGEILDDLDGIAELDAGKGIDLDETIDQARAIIASKSNSRRAG